MRFASVKGVASMCKQTIAKLIWSCDFALYYRKQRSVKWISTWRI